MSRLFKKAKELWDWIGLIWQVVVLLGLSGLVVTVGSAVAAILKGLPWPLALMGAFCTLVATVYLALLPFAVRAYRELTALKVASSAGAALPVAYEAWRHVDNFTLREAAHLWIEREPTPGNATPEVDAWGNAFAAAIRKGELTFIHKRNPKTAQEIIDEKYSADLSTEVSRGDLIAFAEKHGYKPRFLFPE
jgi:hypothetical protein